MCSEVVAHHKPLVYVHRTHFVEEQGLLTNLMEPFGHAIEMQKNDFYCGNWAEDIERAFELVDTSALQVLACDGDVMASEKIISLQYL